VLNGSGQIPLYELTKEFLKDSAYASPYLMEMKKSQVTLSYWRGLESLTILLRVEFFSLVNPLVPLDPIGGGVEFLRDPVDIL
jgi:hypothetical protein